MDDSNIKKLIEAFISGDSDVQRRAKEALVKLGPSAVSALCEKLKYSNRDVQWSSASALGEIKDLTAVPALRKALYDSDSYVRRYSADS